MPDDTSEADGADDNRRESSPDGPDVHDPNTVRDDTGNHWGDRGSDNRIDGTDHERRIGADETRPRTDRDDAGDAYRVPLDLSDTADDSVESDAADDDPYGPEPSSTPVEPGDPELENILFVIFGALAMLLVVFQVVSIPL